MVPAGSLWPLAISNSWFSSRMCRSLHLLVQYIRSPPCWSQGWGSRGRWQAGRAQFRRLPALIAEITRIVYDVVGAWEWRFLQALWRVAAAPSSTMAWKAMGSSWSTAWTSSNSPAGVRSGRAASKSTTSPESGGGRRQGLLGPWSLSSLIMWQYTSWCTGCTSRVCSLA